MYYSNERGMATLIHQKNCMKTLTNVNVNGGGAASSNSTTGQGVQQTRMLLPHEMVDMTSSISSSIANSGNSSITVMNSSCYNTQQMFDQIPQQNQTQTIQSFSHNPVNNIPQFSRYFSQFHSNDSIYMANTSANNANNLSNNSHILLTNSCSTTQGAGATLVVTNNSITQHSSYHQPNLGINKQTVNTHQLPPNTCSDNSAAQYTAPFRNEALNSGSIIGINGCDELESSDRTTDALLPNGIQSGMDFEPENQPEIDIVINNVVCSFSVRCHLNLRDIALHGFNVEYRRENGMVTMKLRRPYTTASIWSSGRITCTGATSEALAKIAARRYARCLQKLGFNVRFQNFRVVNVLGTCSMPWAIKIVNFSEKYKKDASYEPELHPGVTYKLLHPKATLKIFSTGSITVTAASVAHVQAAIEHIYPLVYEFRKERSPEELELLRLKQNREEERHSPSAKQQRPLGLSDVDLQGDIVAVSDCEGDDPDDV